jgi:putative ABC transport system permease protein
LHPLNQKLRRDLWHIKGQVLAIALVMASGVAVLIMSLTAVEALGETARAYYDRYRFADAWATVVRAPERVKARVAQIPGVRHVETRIVKTALLRVAGFDEPVVAQLVSLPERRTPLLNQLAMRSGRVPDPESNDEVVMSEPFAEAHDLVVGDRVRAIIGGHRRTLRIVGLALSPEYIYTIGPGALMPDDKRFGAIWMGRRALQAAFDLDGAFNDISVGLLHGAAVDAVVDSMDRILARYGGVGAFERADQISNWFLMNEIEQLKTLAGILPTVFLAVAAFLTNMVLARLIAVERSEIGLLKAFGYGNVAVAWHYVKLVLCIAGLGVLLGWFGGYWLGLYNTSMYAEFYRFPFLLFDPSWKPFLVAGLVSVLAALVGTLSAVRRAARLAPAAAMQPPAPPAFKRTALSTMRVSNWLDQSTRIVLRQIARWPVRSMLTSVGTGMSVAVLVASVQWIDAINHMANVYFDEAQRQDVSLGMVDVRSTRVLHDLVHLPGVLVAEPMRILPAKFKVGHLTHRGSLQGVPAHQRLHLVYDAEGHALDLPSGGLVLSTMLAEILDVRVGDVVRVEILDGRRPVIEVPVTALFETYIGTPAYIEINALNRLMGDRPVLSVAHVRVESDKRAEFFDRLQTIPEVASVTVKQAALETFHDTMAETIMIFVSFFMLFSCTLAFGVTYNASRIALSERGRELATLRVLGFSRAEISYILLGEAALLTALALPLGCAIGYLLVTLITSSFTTELYRVPLVLQSRTFGWAIVIVILASAASAVLVRRRLDSLDLISVLKTRE